MPEVISRLVFCERAKQGDGKLLKAVCTFATSPTIVP
jgi:hypothetical protein